jgi:hypothetical protein
VVVEVELLNIQLTLLDLVVQVVVETLEILHVLHLLELQTLEEAVVEVHLLIPLVVLLQIKEQREDLELL